MGLGHGLHNCLGAALARPEADVATPEFVREADTRALDAVAAAHHLLRGPKSGA